MSKTYYVGHDDGRAVFIHPVTQRCYVQYFCNHSDDLKLLCTRQRKEVEKILKRTLEAHWLGFKVKRLRK